jgi:glycosyltransferase involved in cell wall biosynthesis
MRIVNVSYVKAADATQPNQWLARIKFYTEIVECMARSHEVYSIHCIGYSGHVKQGGVSYQFFKLTAFQRIFPSDLNAYIKNLNPDAVIIHGFHFPWKVLTLRNALGSNVKFFLQHHAETPYSDSRQILQRKVDRFIDGYFFTAHDLANPFLDAGIIFSRKKIVEVMEASSTFRKRSRGDAKQELGIREDAVYLWVGRLDDNKDPITLLNAFIPFARQNPSVLLNLIFKDEGLLNEVNILLANGPHNIRQVGKVEHEQLEVWFNASDFILSTSHYEGSGISVCEGMSCGCIPIVSNIPSFAMMTANHSIGLTFKPGDSESLSLALKKSLSINREAEQQKTLVQFQKNLSSESIATKMLQALNHAS